MKILPIVLLMVAVQLLVAQPSDFSNNTAPKSLKKLDHSFEVGSSTRILASRVNVRAQPSTTAATLHTLALGTPVKILEKRIEEHSHKGFIASWYRVSFKTSRGRAEGYVWGGLLALCSVTSSADSSIVFLFGRVPEVQPSPKDPDKYYPAIQIRVCQEGQELASLQLATQLNYNNNDYWVWICRCITNGIQICHGK